MPRHPSPWQWKGRKGWYARVKGRVIKLADTKPEAHQRLHRILSGAEQGPAVDGLRTDQLCAEFTRLGTARLAVSTQRWYERHLDSFLELYGTVQATEVRPIDVTRWLATHRWNETTQRGAVTAVKRAFRWGARQGLIAQNPLADLEKPSGERRQATMTPQQVQAVVDHYPVGDPWRAFLEALRGTGCRPGEVADLTARDVDLRAGTWTVRNKTRRATREPTRTVYLTDAIVEMSGRLVERYPSGPIFRNQQGRAWTRNAMACRFARLRARLGMGKEATAYCFRHAWITDALESGVPIATVAELVGHTGTAMISRCYSRLSERRQYLRNAAAAVRPAVDTVPAVPADQVVVAPPYKLSGTAPHQPG